MLKFVLEFKKELLNRGWISDLNWIPLIKFIEEKNGDTLNSTVALKSSLSKKEEIINKLHTSLNFLKLNYFEISKLEAELLRIIDQDTRIPLKN